MEKFPSFKQFEAQVSQRLFAKRAIKIFGPSPSGAFIGRFGYPNVYVGPTVIFDESLFESKNVLDNPSKWYGKSMQEVATLITSLARGEKISIVNDVSSRLVLDLQDNVLSTKPLDLEVKLEKPFRVDLNFSNFESPTAAGAKMNSFTMADNPVIPRKIDSLVNESISVREALPELINSFENSYIQKVLSVGAIGEKIRRKLVPTRWSITATDKMIADLYIEKLKIHPEVEEVFIYSNSYMDNHYWILLLPSAWEFEQFETWTLNGIEKIEHEYEPYSGRSDYAKTEGGGYYASRVAVSEFLANAFKRQARVVVFREIGPNYAIPVGVWQVREGVKHCFDSLPMKFDSQELAEEHLKSVLKVELKKYKDKSKILNQKKLGKWLNF